MVKRVISILLVAILTGCIWEQTSSFAKRRDFAIVANSEETDITYGEYGNSSEIEDEFKSKKDELEKLVGNSDEETQLQVKTLFAELYGFLKDVVTSGGEVRDLDSAEEKFTDIFNGLFALDTKLYNTSPELMGELTNKGFVTTAIGIVWDIVTFYDNNRVNSQTMKENVTRLEDIPYIDDGSGEHMLDIFYPEGTKEKLPVIIDIHGGGLMMGDKDSNRVYCSYLAERGYTVVALNYRLSPDVLYPSQVQDIMAAFKWVHDNADKYFIDLEKVYVTGDSAGGQLAYYVPLVNTSEQLQALYEVEPSGLEIDALGLVSGMYDFKNGFNAPLLSCYFGFDYKNSPYYNYLQPEEVLDLGALPPSYIVTCSRDFLHASGVYFDEILTEKNIEHQFRDWGLSVTKGSGHITSVAYPEIEESQNTINEMLAFFESHTK
ncbi:MAG: alpha/beta hydrolase [Clostridia bacterium]|nr:alpha/beta hydrolase [Clostridia bacterium]